MGGAASYGQTCRRTCISRTPSIARDSKPKLVFFFFLFWFSSFSSPVRSHTFAQSMHQRAMRVFNTYLEIRKCLPNISVGCVAACSHGRLTLLVSDPTNSQLKATVVSLVANLLHDMIALRCSSLSSFNLGAHCSSVFAGYCMLAAR